MDVSPVARESKNTTCWANLSQVNLNDEDSVRHILHNSMEPPMKFQYGDILNLETQAHNGFGSSMYHSPRVWPHGKVTQRSVRSFP